MRQDARPWVVGAIGIGVLVVALVWMLGGDGPDARPAVEAPEEETAEPLPPTSLETDGRVMAPEAARDLAARLARSLDGGVPRPGWGTAVPVDPAVERPAPGAPAPPADGPRTELRIERPLGASERVDYASRLHDGIVLRRDELRQRLAELERTGQGDSAQAGRVRWEIARLDQAEPTAAAQVEARAAEAREDGDRAEQREGAEE